MWVDAVGWTGAFVGRMAASTSFTIYSVLLDNWVFAVSNSAMLLTAILGQAIFLRNRKAVAAAESRSR